LIRADIWHNVLWSQYKAKCFNEIHKHANSFGVEVSFFQIAATDGLRPIAHVDFSVHQYPYHLLYPGSSDAVPWWKRAWDCSQRAFVSDAEVILLPGFNRLEYWAMLFVARLRGKKCGVFCDSTRLDNPQTWIKSLLKRYFLSLCDRVFCYGVRAAEYVQGFGVPKSKCVFRCQAASLPLGYDARGVPALRIQAQRLASEPMFLYVGRLSPEKGITTFLKAMKGVLALIPAARFKLVGDGPMKGELEALASTLGINASVEFSGSVRPTDVANIYGEASCLVLPSISEPWGLVVNEALSYGCPVLVSDRCGCVPELVSDPMTGMVFEAGNVVQLTERLLAAPTKFADWGSTAEHCLEIISSYTPQRAAESILAGVKSMER
jgi:glycosyltransferase involved in cell wall biosynthesis